MKISELWLRELWNTSITSEMLFNKITMLGLEVGETVSINQKFNNIIVGEIIECVKHPKFNNLLKIKINIGEKQLLNIFCNAPNCKQGLKTAVTKTNSILNNTSNKILCSYGDLGISNDYKKIIELPKNAVIGANIQDYLKLYDNIIEINITPNRSDCLSIFGIARDLSINNKSKLNKPQIKIIKPTINNTISVENKNPNACPRFLNRIIKNINISIESPTWIKEKLRRCCINSKNVITDIINYVLIELGQPQHVYDLDKINNSIVIRMANNKEKIILKNNIIKTLKEDTLIISDNSKIIGIAGIICSSESSISNKTKNIMLECAFFNPQFIVGKSQYYGIQTESSYRFERGVDYNLQYKAIERTSELILKTCGGDISNIIDITNESYLPKKINIILTRKKLNKMIGHHIDDKIIFNILTRIGCQVLVLINTWKVSIPSWRFDIQIEENLIEEIIRIYGYNKIYNNQLNFTFIKKNNKNKSIISLNRIKTLLIDRGFQEVITYSFINPKTHTLLHPQQKIIKLLNPISNKMSIMRSSLLTSLLNTITYNKKRQQNRIKIFETGLCYFPNKKSEHEVKQELMLSCIITGNKFKEHWSLNKTNIDFFDLKGDLEAIFNLTNNLEEIRFKKETYTALHPGQSSSIFLKNKKIGFIGVIHPFIEQKFNLNNRTVIFEIKINSLKQKNIYEIKKIPHYPTNRRDISIIISKNITADEVLNECKKISVNNVIDINLFDVYTGKEIKKGYKNFTISLMIQNPQGTMKEKDIIEIVDLYITSLKKKFNAYLRE